MMGGQRIVLGLPRRSELPLSHTPRRDRFRHVFVVGYVEGTPVSVTVGQYNVLAGQVWIVVPLTLLFSPLLFGWYLSS